MRIKRFEAKDTQSAMAMVKRELGEDAVILATRSLPPAEKGARSRIEVMAAMDYDLDAILVEEKSKAALAPPAYGYQSVRRAAASDTARVESIAVAASVAGVEKPALLESHDLRLQFANLMQQGGGGKTVATGYRPETICLDESKSKKRSKRAEPNEVRQWRDQIVDRIRVAKQDGDRNSGPALIALVGATGVGKTTTAAKLAAWYTLRQGLRVALLSMDCYRIGATDQLRTYAQIMRLPCEIVLRRQDLARALARLQDKDIVIIDTAGKSPYDEAHVQELADWFRPCPDVEPHLVLSATSKKEDLQAILGAYGPLSVSSLILTKLDETRAYASLCQQVVASSLPVSYLSTGQRVPEDFLVASKEFLDTLFKQGWPAAVPYMRHY
ncbi:MAG: flagellar biosynthesis protein FlhF [Desulfobulbaceae bacterium]|nr:flagellar biosynthesis protein FlhF [Desulfobulbaceae bacterium]